jgi:hypothetical protein
MINQKLSTLIQVVAATALVNTVINVQPTQAAVLTTFEAATMQNGTYYNQFGNNDDNGSVTVYNQTFNGNNASTVVGNQHYSSGSPTINGVTKNYQWIDNGKLIGTYDQIFVRTADSYGGAVDPSSNGGRSNYLTVNPSLGGLSQTTLTFEEDQKYFGMWWSAGDNKNRLAFYDGDNNMVGNFDSNLLTKTIQQMPVATQDLYKGNPLTSPNQNTGEYYAYVNFFTTGTSSIRKVVFSNATSTGFESDNHSVATSYNSIRGTAVPEPLTVLGALIAIAFGIAFKLHAAKVNQNSEFEGNPAV